MTTTKPDASGKERHCDICGMCCNGIKYCADCCDGRIHPQPNEASAVDCPGCDMGPPTPHSAECARADAVERAVCNICGEGGQDLKVCISCADVNDVVGQHREDTAHAAGAQAERERLLPVLKLCQEFMRNVPWLVKRELSEKIAAAIREGE